MRAPTPAEASAAPAPIPILMYHRIGPIGWTRAIRRDTVPVFVFRAQMRALERSGYQGVSMRQLIDGWNGVAPLPRMPVALTFDDAYADTIQYALPVLKARGWSATIYAVSGLTGGTSSWRETTAERELPLANAEALRQVAEEGFEIGAHSRTHPYLTRIAADEAEREISESRHELEALTGSSIRGFCYPYGDTSPAVMAMVERAGFDNATTVEFGWADPEASRFALRRLGIQTWRLSPGRLLDLIEHGRAVSES